MLMLNCLLMYIFFRFRRAAFIIISIILLTIFRSENKRIFNKVPGKFTVPSIELMRVSHLQSNELTQEWPRRALSLPSGRAVALAWWIFLDSPDDSSVAMRFWPQFVAVMSNKRKCPGKLLKYFQTKYKFYDYCELSVFCWEFRSHLRPTVSAKFLLQENNRRATLHTDSW